MVAMRPVEMVLMRPVAVVVVVMVIVVRPVLMIVVRSVLMVVVRPVGVVDMRGDHVRVRPARPVHIDVPPTTISMALLAGEPAAIETVK